MCALFFAAAVAVVAIAVAVVFGVLGMIISPPPSPTFLCRSHGNQSASCVLFCFLGGGGRKFVARNEACRFSPPAVMFVCRLKCFWLAIFVLLGCGGAVGW